MGLQTFVPSSDGKKLHFICKFKDLETTAESNGQQVIEIEEVTFDYESPQALFQADSLAYGYRNFKLPGNHWQIAVTSYSAVITSILKSKVYFEFVFQTSVADAQLVRRELPFQITSMVKNQELISLLTTVEGSDHLMLLREDGTVLLDISEDQYGSAMAEELRTFLKAFDQGYVEIEGDVHTYLDQRYIVELDLGSRMLRKFPHNYESDEWTNPKAQELFEVNANQFKVTAIDPSERRQNRGEPSSEIEIPSGFLGRN
jgi:hypothetical protein